MPLSRLDDAIQRMDDMLARLRDEGDRREIFLSAYRIMTQQMHASIAVERFVDAAWTTHCTARFAEIYFEAHEAWDADPSTCPAPWARAFGHTIAGRTNVLESLLLGMNVHIAYDLPQALAETFLHFDDLAEDGTPPGPAMTRTLARRRYDHDLVNHVLARTIDPIQDHVAERFARRLAWLDRMALRWDELIAEQTLRHYRERVWHQGLALACAASDEERERMLRGIESQCLQDFARFDTANLVPIPFYRRLVLRRRGPL